MIPQATTQLSEQILSTSKPHGGSLVSKISYANEQKIQEVLDELAVIEISEDVAKDVENVATGVFSPLTGFMNRDDFTAVLREGRLSNDLPWTIPIILDASQSKLDGSKPGDVVALVNSKTGFVAELRIEEIYPFDKKEFAGSVYGTNDLRHPGVALTHGLHDRLVGGDILLLRRGQDALADYRLDPLATRMLFKSRGWKTVVGFQTRNVPHVGHEYLQKTTLTLFDGVFVNPVMGKKKAGDFRDEVILAAYKQLLRYYYPRDKVHLSILETTMRYAGPREAIFHAIIRKNFGCSHFIVGRDHAGVGNFYSPLAAQDIFAQYPDLGITPVFFPAFYYCKRCNAVANEKICPHPREDRIEFSGTRMRSILLEGDDPPKELVRKEVVDAVRSFENPFWD